MGDTAQTEDSPSESDDEDDNNSDILPGDVGDDQDDAENANEDGNQNLEGKADENKF